MFNKVLVLSVSAGAGHTRAGEALELAIRQMNAAREVRHIDALQYTNKLFHNLYSKAYIDLVNKAPDMLGWLYNQLDKPWKNDRVRLAFDKLNTRPFVRLLEEYGPDMMICTHFLPAEIISWLKAKGRLDCPQAIVVTDFDVHAMWLCHHYEHYFVALEETRVHLEQLGIPPSKISVSGIPIDPVFALPKDKNAMRQKHGLDLEKTTVLVSAGGFAVGPIQNLISSLAGLRRPAQLLVVCGHNRELKNRVERLAPTLSANRALVIKTFGFTSEMDELMAASDILVGKPGGLTTAEALSKGLVLVIVNPIPGQEERNADHLLEEGVAIRCNNLPALAYKIDRLLDDRSRFESMRAKALALARPNAARAIVSKLLELSGMASA
ncbi:MAG TPA: glycosyltransferase [Candidatus Acidoferrales bacterium]|nr:glycosyltransferase [Candidatus Acidoferrales bacterium]